MLSKIRDWVVKPSSAKHFDALDGLRGIAIILVVCFHTFYINPDRGPFQRAIGDLLNWGRMGVPIFFVLSGFLISYPFFKNKNNGDRSGYPRGYAWRRIGKILPPYYLSIAVFILFYWVRLQDPAYTIAGLKWAIALGSFLPIVPDFDSPYWSLMIEIGFYITLPLLFWILKPFPVRVPAIVIPLVLVLVPLAVRFVHGPPAVAVPGGPVDLVGTRFPYNADYFAWGVAFAALYALGVPRDGSQSRLAWVGYVGVGLLVATILLLGYWTASADIVRHPTRLDIEVYHWCPGLAAFCLLFFVFDPGRWGARLLSAGWLRFTGIISYEWFLFHYPVVSWFRSMVGDTHGNVSWYLVRTVVPAVLTFVVAAVIYRSFSLPILNYIRNHLERAKASEQ